MGSIFPNAFFLKTWTKLVNIVFVDSSEKKENIPIQQIHQDLFKPFLKYGRTVEAAPNPTLFLKGYDDDAEVVAKRTAPTSRKEPPDGKKILRKEPPLESKKPQ